MLVGIIYVMGTVYMGLYYVVSHDTEGYSNTKIITCIIYYTWFIKIIIL